MRSEVSERRLVLGAGGRLGTAICSLLGDDKDGCISKAKEALDITNQLQVEQAIVNCMPTLVINTVAANAGRVKDPAALWATNVTGTMNVFAACGKHGVPLIQVSTGDIFGGFFEKRQFLECDGGYAQAPYLQTRLAAEHAMLARLRCFSNEYWRSGFRFWLLRSSLLFDRPTAYSSGFVHDVASRLVDKKEEIPCPVDVVRNPTYIPWFAGEIKWLADNWQSIPQGIYHICSDGEASLHDTAMYIRSRIMCRGEISRVDYQNYMRGIGAAPGSLAKHVPLCNDKWQSVRGLQAPSWQEQLESYMRDARRK